MQPLVSRPTDSLRGRTAVAGDKSISHRALMLGALAVGETTVDGLLESDDVLATAEALRRLGAWIVRGDDGVWRVRGCGVGGLSEPDSVLDLGNSGTAVRLLMGVAAGHAFGTFFTGDASLRGRPMNRVIEPLQEMGAAVVARDGRLPLVVTGPETLQPITYASPVASAQVKAALLFAGLHAPGETTVVEHRRTRDHSERLMAQFGVTLRSETTEAGHAVSVVGQPELAPAALSVPGDPSSAAFAVVAALAVPGSEITVTGVGVNPLRGGLFETLREMGGGVEFANPREVSGEPVADIAVAASRLRGVDVPAARAPTMIDEYPALAVAAAVAEGRTVLQGLAELRLKESDRLQAIADGLARVGVAVELGDDHLVVHGCGGPPPGPGPDDPPVATHGDHRIAMTFLALGAAAARAVRVDDGAMIATSFPDFAPVMNGLGARIEDGGAPA